MVEAATGVWYRFVLTGTVTGKVVELYLFRDLELRLIFFQLYTGGRLKTESDADSESLQAKWVRDVSLLHLRANDVLPLIEKGTIIMPGRIKVL